MSVFEKINKLNSANARIRSALTDKGVDATDHGAEDFATDIGNMPPKVDPNDYAYVIYKENDEYKRRSEYIGKTITTLSNSHFMGNTSIVSIILPPTITNLGTSSFESCTNLTHVSLEKITTVSRYAFLRCSNLTEIIGPNITSYDNYNSLGGSSSKLKRVILPKLSTIPEQICMNYKELRYADISGAKKVGAAAFDGCINLSNIVGRDFENIDDYAFRSTDISGELSLPKLKILGYDAFRGTKITKVRDLGQIERLYANCFSNCSKLSFLRVPQTVTRIDSIFQYGQPEVSFTIVCEPTTPPDYSNTDLNTATAIYVPDESVDSYKAATGWSAIASKIHPLSEYTGSD